MDARWFKEERGLPRPDQAEAKEEITKIIMNSSIIRSRLRRMLEEDLQDTYAVAEDFDNPAWEREVIAAADERKLIKRYLKLIP